MRVLPQRASEPSASTPLHQAASAGQAETISALLLRGEDKDARDQHGSTSLLLASEKGRLAAVKTLLAAGAHFDVRDTADYSVLDCAAMGGHTRVIQAILEHGADVNSSDGDSLTALHKAAMKNQTDAIDTLVEAGADIEFMANEGDTPLFLAASQSFSESMLTLLKRGAEVMMCDEFAYSPMHQACVGRRPGLEKAVDLLLRWGADETALNEDGLTPAEVLDHDLDESENHCSQEEVERARLLLARAPADRTWRRRGWLVMLRSRASKVRVASHGGVGNSTNGDSSGSDARLTGDREGESQKAGTTEAASEAGGEQGNRREQRRGGDGGEARNLLGVGAGGGSEGGGVGFSGIVALLLELELEDVFRSVVGFL